MKKIDWRYLRLPVIVCSISLFMAGLLLIPVNAYYQKISLHYQEQDRQYAAVKRKFDEARRNRALYQQYLVQYKELQKKGIIGEEQRLSWIEELQNLNKKYNLNTLSYEISPQKVADLPKIPPSTNVKVYVSTMKLKAGLLHEGDAMRLFQELKSKAKGLYALQQCELDSKFRRDQPVTYSPHVSYVQLECELNWYSIMAKAS